MRRAMDWPASQVPSTERARQVKLQPAIEAPKANPFAGPTSSHIVFGRAERDLEDAGLQDSLRLAQVLSK
jgi:hypothetical protein